MKTLIIKIHSIVDVITNSSTVIYTQCHNNTITYMKDVINSILKSAGSDKTADDLYEFERVVPDGDVLWELMDSEGLTEEEAKVKIEEARKDGSLAKLVRESCEYEFQYEDSLKITLKAEDLDAIDIMEKISKLFSQEAMRDG